MGNGLFAVHFIRFSYDRYVVPVLSLIHTNTDTDKNTGVHVRDNCSCSYAFAYKLRVNLGGNICHLRHLFSFSQRLYRFHGVIILHVTLVQ